MRQRLVRRFRLLPMQSVGVPAMNKEQSFREALARIGAGFYTEKGAENHAKDVIRLVDSQAESEVSSSNPHVKWLREAASHLHAEHRTALANTCEQAANDIERLEREKAAGEFHPWKAAMEATIERLSEELDDARNARETGGDALRCLTVEAAETAAPLDPQPIPVTEIVAALERESANTDTDPRWLAAVELRRMAAWEARTLMCRIDQRPSLAQSPVKSGAEP